MKSLKTLLPLLLLAVVSLKTLAIDVPEAEAPTPPVIRIEYFFDTDPGRGKGIEINFSLDGDEVAKALFEPDVAHLNPGSHQLYIRAQNQDGEWNTPSKHSFFIQPFAFRESPGITRLEYFKSDDPGLGKGSSIDITEGVIKNLSIATTPSDENSHHWIGLRVVDSEGNWSMTKYCTYFQLPSLPVTAIEWSLNDEDGTIQNGVVSMNPSSQNFTKSIDVGITGTGTILNSSFTLSANLVLLDRIPTHIQTLNFTIDGLFDPLAFLIQPQNLSVMEGQPFSLSAEVRGNPPVTLQWLKDGAPIAGAVELSYSIASASLSDSGGYTLEATDAYGTHLSDIAVVQVETAGPIIIAHPADLNKDMVMSIEEVTAYGAAWKRSAPWTIEPNPIPIAYVTRAGALWKGGETYRVNPNIPEPPLWWINTAASPLSARRSPFSVEATRTMEDNLVTIAITSLSDTGTYAFEEIIPNGWSVSMISEQGQWLPEQQLIRWGPYMDASPRVLSYRIQSPEETPKLDALNGWFSVDGKDHLIHAAGPNEENSSTPQLTFESKSSSLRIQGVPGETYIIQATEALGHESWENVYRFNQPVEAVYWKDPNQSEFISRFYRLVIPPLQDHRSHFNRPKMDASKNN